MAWTDASRKGAAVKKAMNRPVALKSDGAKPIAAPVQNPHQNNQNASHARGYFRHKMPK